MSDQPRIQYASMMSAETQTEFTGERFVPGVRGEIELEHVHRYLFARQFVEGRDVLDIACGEGYGCVLMSGIARSVIGVDIDTDVIDRARSSHAGDNIDFKSGSCTSIPMADASIDVVVSFETIEHIDQHDQFMAEIRRVLRPGGLLLISTPDTRTYVESSPEQNPFHVKEMDKQEFIDLLTDGFNHARFGVQRCLAGSLLVPLDSESSMTTPALYRLDASSSTVEDCGRFADAGMFLIGIASDDPLPSVDWGLLDDPTFSMAQQADLEHRNKSLEGSVTEYEAAMKETLAELHQLRRSLVVRIASRLGLAPRRSDSSS